MSRFKNSITSSYFNSLIVITLTTIFINHRYGLLKIIVISFWTFATSAILFNASSAAAHFDTEHKAKGSKSKVNEYSDEY